MNGIRIGKQLLIVPIVDTLDLIWKYHATQKQQKFSRHGRV